VKSKSKVIGSIDLPLIEGEFSMMPFDLKDLYGLEDKFKKIAEDLLFQAALSGTAFLTVHGKVLNKFDTLRRGGPHTDGSYDQSVFDWGSGGGNGWKVGENGPSVNSKEHNRLYNSNTGGIVLASNFESCLGWNGEYNGLPNVGGDCSHIDLDKPFMLERNKIYYGNNHFIHESIPVSKNCHRVFARITLPEDHVYQE